MMKKAGSHKTSDILFFLELLERQICCLKTILYYGSSSKSRHLGIGYHDNMWKTLYMDRKYEGEPSFSAHKDTRWSCVQVVEPVCHSERQTQNKWKRGAGRG